MPDSDEVFISFLKSIKIVIDLWLNLCNKNFKNFCHENHQSVVRQSL